MTTLDSDGVPDGLGFSVATVTVVGGDNHDTDFGFFTPPVQQPGTGTPGYWKNHPEAWPVADITVGGVTYTKAEAIAWLEEGRQGQDHDDVQLARPGHAERADRQRRQLREQHDRRRPTPGWPPYGPVGSNVAASSYAWTVGEPLHQPDGQLQQRPALRAASQLDTGARWPFPRVIGHSSFNRRCEASARWPELRS